MTSWTRICRSRMPDFPSQNMPFQIYVFFPSAAEKSLKVKLAVARFSQDHEGPAFCTGSTACLAGNYCGASHKQRLNLQSPDGMRCATVTHTVPCLYAGPADFLCRRVVNLCLSPVLGKARRCSVLGELGCSAACRNQSILADGPFGACALCIKPKSW